MVRYWAGPGVFSKKMAGVPSLGLVAYREGSSGSDSEEEYILPQKRAKADRTVKGGTNL